MIEWESIAMLLTNKCNIKCEHCLINAGPENKDLFDIYCIDNIINGMNMVGIKVVGITGGEPLVFKKYLKYLCCKFNEFGISSMIATNAFWAPTLQDADNLVGEMKNWGVRKLILSLDEYHQKWIPAQNVFNAVKMAIQHEIRYEVHISALNVEIANKYYNLLMEKSIFNVYVNAIEIVGRAKSLDLKNMSADLRIFSCKKVANPMILLNGDVIACCDLLVAPEYNPDIKSPLYLGNIYRDNLSKILKDASKNPCLILLQKHGPDGILKQLLKTSNNPDIKRVNHEGCKLCYWLLNNEKRAKEVISLLL